MKKFIPSAPEADLELILIEQQEKELEFSKKQCVAYKISEFLKNSQITEIKFLGYVNEGDDSYFEPGYYFDAKTSKNNDYMSLNIYGHTGDERRECHIYANQRLRAKPDHHFADLKSFHKMFETTMASCDTLHHKLCKTMKKGAIFTSKLESAMSVLMSESEYQEWLTLKERHSMELLTPRSNNFTVSHGAKKI